MPALPWRYAFWLCSRFFAFFSDGFEAQASTSTLSFHVASGGNDNYFLRDNVTSAQMLITSANTTGSARRLVIAFPAGNSGALVYFLPMSSHTTSDLPITVTVIDRTFKSITAEYSNVGAEVQLAFNRNATVGVTIIGAVRALRDYVEGSGTMHGIFNYTLHSYNSTFVRLHRQYINSTGPGSTIYKGADLYLSSADSKTQISVTPGNNGTWTPPTINILFPLGGNGTILARVLTNETSLHGLDPQNLFLQEPNNGNPGLATSLTSLATKENPVADQISFLTYTDKFTAGGWRFLTYFGRDSLIALRLLMPILTSDAIESALGAVIERANATGALCHEETVGDYASFINGVNNQSYLGNQPFYDYKAIDTDLYLLPVMSHYFLELPSGKNRAPQFLAHNATLQNGTYGEILSRTINYNLNRAIPFYLNQTHSNLLAFRPGQPVGNWRDSMEGTGYGRIPFDVNTALVPANLRATAMLASAGIISHPIINLGNSNNEREEVNGEGHGPGGHNGNGNGKTTTDTLDDMAALWESASPKFFEVDLDDATAETRLQNFVTQANLSQALLTSSNPQPPPSQVSFYALSLMADGTPVQILHSDLCFNLVFGTNVTKDYLKYVIDALQPYPRGLLTNIGMVVTNPAYDSNTTNINVLNRGAYHGTVVWSFQQGLMAAGLARQLGYCSNSSSTVDTNPLPSPIPSWCSDKAFVDSVVLAQSKLWTSIQGAKENIYSEVWSYSFNNTTNSFSPADLASLSPSGTESDAIQLWSFGFLALLDPFRNSTSMR